MSYYTKSGAVQNPIATVLYQMVQNWYYIVPNGTVLYQMSLYCYVPKVLFYTKWYCTVPNGIVLYKMANILQPHIWYCTLPNGIVQNG